MTVISDYLANQIIGVARNTAFSGISNVYLALFNGDPGSATSLAAGVSEITTTIRSAGRVEITFSAPSTGSTSNTNAVNFGVSEGSTTVKGWGVYDASSGGNLLFYGPLLPNLSVTTNETVKVPAGVFQLDLSGNAAT
jgi:hypothetical protein